MGGNQHSGKFMNVLSWRQRNLTRLLHRPTCRSGACAYVPSSLLLVLAELNFLSSTDYMGQMTLLHARQLQVHLQLACCLPHPGGQKPHYHPPLSTYVLGATNSDSLGQLSVSANSSDRFGSNLDVSRGLKSVTRENRSVWLTLKVSTSHI